MVDTLATSAAAQESAKLLSDRARSANKDRLALLLDQGMKVSKPSTFVLGCAVVNCGAELLDMLTKAYATRVHAILAGKQYSKRSVATVVVQSSTLPYRAELSHRLVGSNAIDPRVVAIHKFSTIVIWMASSARNVHFWSSVAACAARKP